MKRRKLLLAGLAAVVLLCGLGWLIVRAHEPPEPVYQGKRLSDWLHENSSLGGGRNPTVQEAFRQFGTNAIPTLLRMLRAQDSKFKLKLIELAQKQHLIRIHFVRAEDRHLDAVSGFSFSGATASNAVPALIQIYEERLSDSSQMATAYALMCIGPAAIQAVPTLVRTAGNTNSSARVRGVTIQVLGKIHADPELVVPVFTQCLTDSNLTVRGAAVQVLLPYGKDAKAAVPALIELLNGPDEFLKFEAQAALYKIDPEALTKEWHK
jgi:HEAT repeats